MDSGRDTLPAAIRLALTVWAAGYAVAVFSGPLFLRLSLRELPLFCLFRSWETESSAWEFLESESSARAPGECWPLDTQRISRNHRTRYTY